jgi:N-acetylmuramoyl-L-alanine amidase
VSKWPAFALALALALAGQIGAEPAYAATPVDVCLDPGHGGSDPGAVREWNGVTLLEKAMNLYIARQVEAKLIVDHYTVKLTRTDNDATTLGNSDRAQICNSVGAKVVLSIHLNASTNDQADYFQVFYGKKLKDEAFARTIEKSYAIGNAFGSGTLSHASVTNFANGTLLKSKAPAALAEGLFMSHWKEKELLASNYPASARADAVATELHKGLIAWLTRP